MTGRNIFFRKFSLLLSALSITFIIGGSLRASHPNISLYDRNYNQINPVSNENDSIPFSTEVTCGLCHDYETITSGYHFQHGWDVISDTFGVREGKPWILSNGMMGGWSPPSFRQFAKKKNSSADEIDLTSFDFVGFSANSNQPSCGSCHAGGAGMEYDRDGNRYDDYLSEHPDLRDSLDGDYYKSNWDKTGVVEADCFICHLVDYDFEGRQEQLQSGNYQWAVVAGSRFGQVNGSVANGDVPTVVYNTRYFNNDGTITFDPSWPPPDDNCMFCHGTSDVKKRGFSWNDIYNSDIHNDQGISCAACHPGGLEHNFAKDGEVVGPKGHKTRAMPNCKKCHDEGILGSPIPQHTAVRPSHLRRITCEVCHVPELGRSAILGFDVTTGKIENLIRPPSADKIDAKAKWQPIYHRFNGQDIVSTNDMLGAFWGNIDSDSIIYILFQSTHAAAWKLFSDQIKDDNKDGIPEVNTEAEMLAGIKAYEKVLKDDKRFTRVKPVYLTGDKVYGLDSAGKVVALDREFQSTFYYSINHNVAPARMALGNTGCLGCHADTSHFFFGEMISQLWGPDGKPISTSIGRGLGCNPTVFKVNAFHQRILSPIVSTLIVLVVFLITLHYHRFGPKRIPFVYGSGEIKRFSFLERAIHLFRLIAFVVLAVTGVIMAFNWVHWQNLLFASPGQMVLFHVICGFIFAVTTIMGIVVWAKDAMFKDYDKVWVKLSGGYFGEKGEIPAGRFNAGQKMFYWFTTIFGLVMIVTGLILTFRYSFALSTICLDSTVHSLFAFFMIAGVLAHAYLGTIANPGTWRVLIDGYVTKTWAKHHHPNWYRQVMHDRGESADEDESAKKEDEEKK